MLDFSNYIDLSITWTIILGAAIFLYVLLDGFDLGVGIIFPFAPSDQCRSRMMNSIAPFWDGNETWLVLGGGGLFAAFPLAYSILLPAFYMPIILMLLGLIMRGIAFEFRFKSLGYGRKLWDYIFHSGSLIAAFCQGAILGGFIHGVKVEGRDFAGGPFDWASAFSMMTGAALVFGYSLLGATWLIMKTDGVTQSWARKVSSYVSAFVAFFMAIVSISVPFVNASIKSFWFSFPNILYLSVIPLFTLILFITLWRDLLFTDKQISPFVSSIMLFLMGYIGLGISIFPWIIPYNYTIWQAAADNRSLSLMLCGVAPLLPIILVYTGYCYYVFRGKSSHERMY